MRSLRPALLPLCFAAVAFASKDYQFPTDPTKWRSASAEAPPGCVRWEFAKSKAVQIKDVTPDWSPYSALAFTIEVSKASDSKLYVIIRSEDPERNGPDYYLVTLRLNWQGKQDVLLPFSELGRARTPVGFHKIDYLCFHNAWNLKDEPDRDVVVTFSALRLLSKVTFPDRGPRLSDADLFAALDLDRPGFEKAKAARQAGDLDQTKHGIAQHIRWRRVPLWQTSPYDRPTAGMPAQTKRHAKGQGGRYRASFKIDWAGWRCIRLPKEAFQPSGKPTGWNWISGLSLRVPTSQAARHPDTVIYLDDCQLVGKEAERSIGDFETETTGWSNVFRADEQVHSGGGAGKWWFLDMQSTTTCGKLPRDWSKFDELQLWIHSDQPTDLTLYVTADSRLPDTAYADTILTHKFSIGSFRKKVVDFGPRIDWSFNAMSEGESRTIEWNAQLNRHFHFGYLLKAYWDTGDDRYARELAKQMNAWIEDNPVFVLRSGNNPYHHAWETLNTACRLQNTWPKALFGSIQSPGFTDHIIINVLKSVAEQVRHLIKNPTKGNWLTAESLGVYTMGVLFPEFKDAAQWRRIGIERLYNQLNEEVYPDGLEYEVALGYNNWVLREYCAILELAKLNGLLDEVPKDYKARIEKMFDYQMYNCMPNGVGVGLNDSGNASAKQYLLTGYRLFPKRDDFIYALTNGRRGERPPADSIAMPYSGHYIMRSGWHRNARMLHFDAGLFGAGHQHEDKLHLAMYAYGKQLMPDSGNYMYDRSRWRAYVLLTRAHNTVLVDGMDQYRRRTRDLRVWEHPWDAPSPPTDTRFVTTRGLDYAIGFYKHHYREYLDWSNPVDDPKMLDTVTHARRVLFVKPDFWIVHDTLTARDDAEHTYDVLYHMEAATATVSPDTNAVTSVCKDSPNVTIFPLNADGLTVSIVKGKTEAPVQGWTSCNKRWHAIPTAIFQNRWQKEADFICALYPFPEGGRSPIVNTSPLSAARGVKLVLDDESEHVYVANPKPGELVETDGVVTDAEVAFACSNQSERFRLLLVNGTRLSTDGAGLALSSAGTASVVGYGSGVYVVSSDIACECRLRLPGLGNASSPHVHEVDRDGNRVAPVDAQPTDGLLTLQLVASAGYELNLSGKKALKELLAEAEPKHGQSQVHLDFPVKPLPILPPTKGIRIRIQAEDLARQGGGAVTITDKKIGSDGKAFLNWDHAGHWVEWRFSVPQDGAYCLTLKYCADSMAPLRAIVIDNTFAAEFLKAVQFSHTGGWSNERDDWGLLTIEDPVSGAPILLHLRKGGHTLRMENVVESMNLDYFVVHSPDVAAR